MKNYLLTVILLLSQSATIFAQGEHNIWHFGHHAGIDFNTGVPVAIANGGVYGNEGCASISDKDGRFLFSSNGIFVYNRNRTIMPNGYNLNGHMSSTQSALIVPNPDNPSRYYLFTAGIAEPPYDNSAYCWSEVDMTLDGGLGDVIPNTKLTQLLSGCTEKLTAVKHANGLYYWVIGQRADGHFVSYLVDRNGVSPAIISNAGDPPFTFNNYSNIATGYLKASSDGRKLANALPSVGFCLYDFDNATGVVSNRVNLGTFSTPYVECYGVSFSPNNKLLYGLTLRDSHQIYQWDLLAGSTVAIINSRVVVGLSAGGNGIIGYRGKGGAIQEGPDGKLYINQYSQPYLSVINNPNAVGIACDFQINAVSLSGQSKLGLPNFISGSPGIEKIQYQGNCLGTPVSFFEPDNFLYLDSLHWNFGDPNSGTYNTAKVAPVTHLFSDTGTYTVQRIRYWEYTTDTAYITIRINPLPAVNLGPDTAVCADAIILYPLEKYNAGTSLLWNSGSTDSQIQVSQTGTYWLQVTENGCTGSDTVHVEIKDVPMVHLGFDTAICDWDLPIILRSPQLYGSQYQWSNGSADTQMQVTGSGTYWLSVTRNKCVGSDTINVNVVSAPNVFIGSDSIICSQYPYRIGTEVVPEATYRWNTGDTVPYISVTNTDKYILQVNVHGCLVYDTVSVVAMPEPDINIGPNRDLCPGQVMELDGTYESGSRYQWNTSDTTSSISIISAGFYRVDVTTRYHCTGRDSVVITSHPAPYVQLPEDMAICEGTPVKLLAGYRDADLIRWSDGSIGDALTVTLSGAYFATAINKCGETVDTIHINGGFCEINVPDAFSPNGDSRNDIFRVLGSIGLIEKFSLSLFNRWGMRVFYTNNKYGGWDGNYQGEPAPLGTYSYLLEYWIGDNPYRKKGNVQLVR